MLTKFQRGVAFILAVLTAVFCFGTSVSADDAAPDTAVTEPERSLSSNAISEAKELLGTVSYETYVSRYSNETLYPKAKASVKVAGTDYYEAGTTAAVSIETYDGQTALRTGSEGIVAYRFTVPETAKYTIRLKYWPVEGETNATSIQRILRINGAVPFSEAYNIGLTKVWTPAYDEADKYVIESKKGNITRYFRQDIDKNEIRPTFLQTPEWCVYDLRDIDGFFKEPFEFVFEKGENVITFDAVAEDFAIGEIELLPAEEMQSYESYIASFASAPKGTDKVVIQGEEPLHNSSSTIYPVEDRSSALTTPCDTHRVMLNTIGGEKWQVSSQWIEYQFSVNADGLYQIIPRFRQNVNDGLYSSRILYIYSDESVAEGTPGYYNGVPFDEARELRFNYSPDWQSEPLRYGVVTTDEKGNRRIDYVDCEFYFKAGVTYTLKFEVSLGTMGDVVQAVQHSLDTINEAYLNIMRLTGAEPDESRDYFFSSVMPDTVIDIIIQAGRIQKIADELTALSGTKSSNVAILEKMSWILDRMGKNPEEEIARNLKELKSRIGNIGTWLSTAKTQPLQIDSFTIQGADQKKPRANANFFQAFGHEISSFIQSFLRNYDRMGAVADTAAIEESIEIWNAYGRDQAQVIRNLINKDFTPATGYPVNLKLVAGGTLLPSILAGSGPDAYIGLGEDNVINYAIRGALMPIEKYDGFHDMLYYKVDDEYNTVYDDAGNPIRNEKAQFNEAAMLVLGIADQQDVMHYYGLPETQSFPMMFIRSDIMADLGINSLDTWDELLEAATILSDNSMTIGLSNDYKIFLYQMGGKLFADNGMRINLDSNLALDSFETMCNMFTMYSFPYKYDFTNRFRTGEMPIGIAGYNGTYNHLIVFATELRGRWQFVPVPGYEISDGKGGTYINNVSVSTVSAIVMITGCDQEKETWEFMKWHVGSDCQVKYSNEMIAILGDSAKHGTANIQALETMPWTNREKTNLISQFQNLASIPNYPGSYIIGRYTKFSFLGAYNDGNDPVAKLRSYITIINKEISRKRSEFGLETLEIGQTLAMKRYQMFLASIGELSDSQMAEAGFTKDDITVISEADRQTYKAQLDAVKKAFADIEAEDASFKTYIPDNLIDALKDAGNALNAASPEIFGKVCKYISTCAGALKEYQSSYPQD